MNARIGIAGLIAHHPGIYQSRIAQLLGIANGTLGYHLWRLERSGEIAGELILGKRCYFPAEMPAAERRVRGILADTISRSIITALLESPKRNADLSMRLKLSKSTMSWHLGRLTCEGILAKRGTLYELADEALLRRLLAAHPHKLPDQLVGNFSDMWQ